MVARELPRRRRRANERGATLFVVVLAITLLTGVGLYTVHSSTLAARAAGTGRLALQARQLAELGTLTTNSFISLGATEVVSSAQARTGADATGQCEMNEALDQHSDLPVTCFQWSSALSGYPGNLLETDSFGPEETTAGQFRVELTDLFKSAIPVAGMDQNNPTQSYYEGTLTTVSQLRPGGLADTACVENVMQVSGQHMVRAHVLIGPVGDSVGAP